MPNVRQANCALSKEQYLKLLEICARKKITLHKAVKTAIVTFYDLPKQNPRLPINGFDIEERIKELKKELGK